MLPVASAPEVASTARSRDAADTARSCRPSRSLLNIIYHIVAASTTDDTEQAEEKEGGERERRCKSGLSWGVRKQISNTRWHGVRCVCTINVKEIPQRRHH